MPTQQKQHTLCNNFDLRPFVNKIINTSQEKPLRGIVNN